MFDLIPIIDNKYTPIADKKIIYTPIADESNNNNNPQFSTTNILIVVGIAVLLAFLINKK